MPIPLDPRKQPSTIKVHVSTGEGLEIVWSDAHSSKYTFPYLRENCPCAMCNDEREKKSEHKHNAPALSPLPMYKPRVTATGASPVGNYAIQFQFSDSHATGIYSFGHLREICPCEACALAFRSESAAESRA
jgi:DUF971 family protein